MIYDGDSFFTLTPLARGGLVLVSLLLGGLAIGVVRLGRARAMRLVLAVVGFWAFVWLSPQVYYTYYRVILADLPAQSVIKSPPGLTELGRLMAFADQIALNAHSLGALGWAMIAAALWPKDRS